MSIQHSRLEGLSVLRALAFAGLTSVLAACGARADGGAILTQSDGGTAADARPTPSSGTLATRCASACEHARAASCGAFNDQCATGCLALGNGFPTRCSAQIEAYFTCLASARFVCASDGPEAQGCDAQDAALRACIDPSTEPTPNTDQCLPDTSIPSEIAATLCTSVPSTPVPHDCPGGAPSPECVEAPQGQGGVYCCAH